MFGFCVWCLLVVVVCLLFLFKCCGLFGGLVYCDFVGLRIAGFCGIASGSWGLMFWFVGGLALWVVWLCRPDGWVVLWEWVLLIVWVNSVVLKSFFLFYVANSWFASVVGYVSVFGYCWCFVSDLWWIICCFVFWDSVVDFT